VLSVGRQKVVVEEFPIVLFFTFGILAKAGVTAEKLAS